MQTQKKVPRVKSEIELPSFVVVAFLRGKSLRSLSKLLWIVVRMDTDAECQSRGGANTNESMEKQGSETWQRFGSISLGDEHNRRRGEMRNELRA